MKQKNETRVFESNFLLFRYIPSLGVLRLASELSFEYGWFPSYLEFILNIDPYGEGFYCSVLDLIIDNEQGKASCRVEYEWEDELINCFVSDSYHYEYNKIAYSIIDKINKDKSGININEQDLDEILLFLENGKFENLQIYKYKKEEGGNIVI